MVAQEEPYRIGAVIDRRYKIVGHIGKGGMGGVYLAEHLQFRREVAIKVLLESAQSDDSTRQRFETEARAVCHLQHPNLVTYHDFGTDPETGRLYLVMERLNGKTLAQTLKTQSPLPLSRVVHIVAQICDALTVAHHARVIHRDLKPANVMLVPRGDNPDTVKLIDFGIVRVLGEHASHRRLTAAGMLIGTTSYLAPEYIRRQEVSELTDIYALGVMAYELIAGHRPFQSKDRKELMLMHLSRDPKPLTQLGDGRVVPNLLNRVILRALAKDPSQRLSSARDLKAHLLASTRSLLTDEFAASTLKQPAPDSYDDSDTTRLEDSPLVAAIENPTRIDHVPAEISEQSTVRETDTGLHSSLINVPPQRLRPWVLAALGVGAFVAVLAVTMVWRHYSDPPMMQTASSQDVPQAIVGPPQSTLAVVGIGGSADSQKRRRDPELHERRPLIRRALERMPIVPGN